MGPFDILVRQHRELAEQLEALGAGEGPAEAGARREQLEALLALLRLHAVLEERLLYPLLARVEGRSRAAEEAEDHLTMQELSEELALLEPGSDEWLARLMALEDRVVAHGLQEELETFPRITASLDPRQRDELHRALLSLREQLLLRPRVLSGSEPLAAEPTGRG
jgi:hypothetical protein